MSKNTTFLNTKCIYNHIYSIYSSCLCANKNILALSLTPCVFFKRCCNIWHGFIH